MISVAILTRNRLGLLQRCISSLISQLQDGDEIVILDTGSTDGTREWLAQQPPCVRWRAHDEQADFASARNALVRECVNPVVFMTDDDTVPAGDLLVHVRAGISTRFGVGGPALYGRQYALPWWWHPALGWTVGMAGPDTIAALPGIAPATSNFAVRRLALQDNPFGETGFTLGQNTMYRGGREDADWWRQARLRGWRVALNPRQIVFHNVQPERFRWRYVMTRADADGSADWARHPHPGRLSDAANDIVFGALSLLDWPGCMAAYPSAIAVRAVWIRRQFAFLSAARSPWPMITRSLGQALPCVAKKLAAPILTCAHRILRPRRSHPPSRLNHLVIAAPTYLGDTVLVRYIVDALARALPDTRLTVISRFADLFDGAHEGVHHVDAGDGDRCSDVARTCDYALTPYFHHGLHRLWRNKLAPKSATFSSDVGFSRQSDYALAAYRHPKDFQNHELFNLLGLASRCAGHLSLEPIDFKLDRYLNLKYDKMLGSFGSDGYFVIQVGAGLPTKEWPVQRWMRLAQHLWTRFSIPSVIIGDRANHRSVEDEAASLGFTQYLNRCGQTSIPQLIALLRGCQMLVGACSGPKHLAMAVGSPTFTLYGPSEPERWGAFFDAPLHGFVKSPLWGLTPRETCAHPSNVTMLALDVETVTSALDRHCTTVFREKDS